MDGPVVSPAPVPPAPQGLARFRKILSLALPIIGGMVSQNILNLVDTAMVGRLGEESLAAVGIAGFANFMAIAFITGMSAGVQASAARRMGEGRTAEMAEPLNGGLVLAVSLALPWTTLLWWAAPDLFPLLVDDPAVVAEGVPYLRARLLGMAAVGMNYAFRGYWNGVNLSRLYLMTLVVMHATNIFLNWVLIFGHLGMPAYGATGAGMGTMISTWVGTGVYVVLGLRRARHAGFLRGLPTRAELGRMLRVSAPAGLQQFVMACGYTAFFRIVGTVGTTELAAANVVMNVMLVAILPGLGLGIAGASLVGQALGRGAPDDARQWGWDVVKVGVAVMLTLGAPMLLLPELVLAPFLTEAATVAVARPALQVVGATIFMDGIGMVLMMCLQGAGATRTSAVVAGACQWGIGLPLAWLVGPVLGLGLGAVWASQAAYRTVQAVIFVGIWRRGGWAEAQV